ncbi:hypothetical protein K523DRAFT_251827 [Schizophyllum commune Tattone D]|nr:hypothetical protein K523DRAFT_251827 [Schizophyllum commune Tattone D]
MTSPIACDELFKALNDNGEQDAADGKEVYLGLAGLALKHVEWQSYSLKKMAVFKAKSAPLEDGEVRESGTTPAKTAIFVVVARIGSSGTFLAPDGNYRGATGSLKKGFGDIMLSLGLEDPSTHPDGVVFGPHWDTACSQITQVMQLAAGTESITSGAPEKKRITARHAVFEPLPENEHERQKIVESLAGKPSFFNIHNWPVNTEEAKAALPTLFDTHTVTPLPAFDMDEQIVDPVEYRSELIGALALVSMRIVGWNIGETHRFRCEITNIDVLRGPVVEPAKRSVDVASERSPSKRLKR